MDSYSFQGFGINQDGQEMNHLDNFSSEHNTYENAFNFFGHPGMSVRKESDFGVPDLHNLSGVSTTSDFENIEDHEEDHHAAFLQPSEPAIKKRKLEDMQNTIEDGKEHVITRKVERNGLDTYAIDGQTVPRLQLGESGRAQLKSSISSVLKHKPELRKQCNSIEKVKNASIMQLLAMARICGIWDQAVKISESFLKKYPCKKIAGSVDKQVSRLGEMALTSIL
jgi:hypothetical protein